MKKIPEIFYLKQSIILKPIAMFTKHLFESYKDFKETNLTHRRIKHSDIIPLIKNAGNMFNVNSIGKSCENRDIFQINIGNGEKKILLWSQMHGNEPTATQTIFDLLNFFKNPKQFKNEADSIINACKLFFVPMLNPDGAEQFQRRNAQQIDINRDAFKTISPESKLLMNSVDELKPDFGFNLHDQDIWYASGNTAYPATISFLAPAFDSEKTIDSKRKRSMQIIASMNTMLQQFIPGQTAKYNDDFMPTAFGDTIQQKGTSVMLIESGGYKNDPEKQFVRKLNFISILHALKIIADNSYQTESVDSYNKISPNVKNCLFDYIIRNAKFTGQVGNYTTDIGIRSISKTEQDLYLIDDIGDLSQHFAYKEIEFSGNPIHQYKIGDSADKLINRFFTELK